MSNEQRNTNQGGRRRYFRRRPTANPSGAPGAQRKDPAPAKKQEGPREATPPRPGRMGRRRRRTRATGPVVTPKVEPTAESIVNLSDYQPPARVFIYTHVLRPDSRDSYEFRAEHFSKVGRRLEDYEIDLSKLFSDEQRAEADNGEYDLSDL
jgi:hypothetical protein